MRGWGSRCVPGAPFREGKMDQEELGEEGKWKAGKRAGTGTYK